MKILPKNSLRELPKDPRDFNLGAIFIQANIKDVPNADFVVATPLVIKDQGESDYCSAYALTAVSEDQEGVELLPEYQFYKTKQLSGKLSEWGANLRDACKSATKFGSIPQRGNEGVQQLTRDEIFNLKNWRGFSDEKAALYKKQTYFEVKGRYDVFDDIRTYLWQFRKEKCSILTGAIWRQSWLESQNGILPPTYEDDGFGHAFKIFGQKVIGEKLYLIAQLSQGENVGDGGLFYLSREIVNKEVGRFGIYMFKDLPREDVESILKKKESLLQKLLDFISNLFR